MMECSIFQKETKKKKVGENRFGKFCSIHFFQYIIHNITIAVTYNSDAYEVGFTDLCMSYDWKCFMNEHITMLMPKERWGNFDPKLAEFTDDIIANEVLGLF